MNGINLPGAGFGASRGTDVESASKRASRGRTGNAGLRTLALALLVVLWGASAAHPAELRIGYANLQKALNESEAGVKAKESLKEEAERLEKEINARREEIEKMREEMEKKESVWNAETREAKEKEFKARSQDFQKQFMQYNEELKKRKASDEARIIDELRAIIADAAKKKGYTYVFEYSMGALLYAPPDADMTEDVIKIYNKEYKAKAK
jgi:outer membrane protein